MDRSTAFLSQMKFLAQQVCATGGKFGSEGSFYGTYWKGRKKTSKRVVEWWSDWAKEYMSKALESYFAAKRIGHQTILFYSPESNNRAERLNRTINKRMRTILEEHYALIWKITRICRAKHWMRSFTLTTVCLRTWLTSPCVTRSRMKSSKDAGQISLGFVFFGCDVKIKKRDRYRRDESDVNVWEGIHVAYHGNQAYRIFVPQLKWVSVSLDVTFMKRIPIRFSAPGRGSVDDRK